MVERHDEAVLIRYIESSLPVEEQGRVEAHLAACAECREFVTFARDLCHALAHGGFLRGDPGEPCPAPELITELVDGALEADTARHVRAHLLHCNSCSHEYLLLMRLEGEGAPEEEPTERQTADQKVDKDGSMVMVAGVHVTYERVGSSHLTVSYKISIEGVLSCTVRRSPTDPYGVPVRLSIWSPAGRQLKSGELKEWQATLEVTLDDPCGVHILRLEADSSIAEVRLTPPSMTPTQQPA